MRFLPLIFCAFLIACSSQSSHEKKKEKVVATIDETSSKEETPKTTIDSLSHISTIEAASDSVQSFDILYKNVHDIDLRNTISLSLISKDSFDLAKSVTLSIQPSSEDPFHMREQDSTVIVTLRTKEKVILEGTTDYMEDQKELLSVGKYFPDWNAFTINIDYWEWSDTKLYNAMTGEELMTLVEAPLRSPNGTHMIAIRPDGYEVVTYFQLIKYEEGKFRVMEETQFSEWMPGVEPEEIKWVNDSTVFLKIQYAKEFWNEDGSYNTDYKYLKMVVKGIDKEESLEAQLYITNSEHIPFNAFFGQFVQYDFFREENTSYPVTYDGIKLASREDWKRVNFPSVHEALPTLTDITVKDQETDSVAVTTFLLDEEKSIQLKFVEHKGIWRFHGTEEQSLTPHKDYEFLKFLAAFTSDSTYQKQHLSENLKKKTWGDDDQQTEFSIDTSSWEYLPLSEAVNPVFSLPYDVESDKRRLYFSGIDNGIYVEYVFVKIDGEWVLTEWVDFSN
ncbi:DUF4348 domain-containing protein [Algivirga pacifica]|uniref:Lipoprotein n=1 Tax=Algivirga pacifica TaxID=1162670 RepID=A0ABP9DB23_9BACT